MPDLAEELFKFNPWWEKEFRPDFVLRPRYDKALRDSVKHRDIVLVTGLRRVGKTTLMRAQIRRLLDEVDPKFIFYASLDSLTLEKFSVADMLREFRKLHRLKREQRLFLFLDEVAHRKTIHQELKNLYDSENVKVFASSSSASILRDTGAMLTGRSRVLEVLPLDFNEYLSFKAVEPKGSERYLTERHFDDYMRVGGMPEYVLTEDIAYLDNLVEGIIYKDIMAHFGIRDAGSLRDFFRLLMERVGKPFTLNKVSRIAGLSTDTVRRYAEYFSQTYLVYFVERCGKLNERLRAPRKIYAADHGIRNLVTGFKEKGAIFENLVFLKLKGKNPCYVYERGTELDFLIGDRLVEVKYGQPLSGKQRLLFDRHGAKEKLVIDKIEDYMDLDDLLGQ